MESSGSNNGQDNNGQGDVLDSQEADEDIFAEVSKKPTSIPYSRFKEVLKERDSFKSKIEGSEEHLALLGKYYGDGESIQIKEFEDDQKLLDVIAAHKQEPVIKEALKFIFSMDNTVRVRDENSKDPVLSQLVRERVQEKTQAIFDSRDIRPELQPLILKYVMEKAKPTANEEDIKDIIREYVADNKWNRDFLISGNTQKSNTLPRVSGGRHVSVDDSESSQQESPKSLNELKARRAARWSALEKEMAASARSQR